MVIANKNIILGVSGGIAAYKTPDLVRRLREQGANVRVVMTEAAKEFVTPSSLQAVSGEPVFSRLFDRDTKDKAGMDHIELARWADLILIAPATANIIAKLNHGQADDLLTTLCLATGAKCAIAPAMNQQMWQNEQTQENVQALKRKRFTIIGPASGEQACGEVGFGRMLEPDLLAKALNELFHTGVLAGKKVLITAGPTREALDAVRYLSNHSSGKMGFALAVAAVEAGAAVTLIAGPVALPTPLHVRRIDVVSAVDMHNAVLSEIDEYDIFIGAAAVADYRVEQIAKNKIKKTGGNLDLTLVPNPDILKSVTEKNKRLYSVGFAAETTELIRYGQEKLTNKKCNMIIANNVGGQCQGFYSNDNACVVITHDQQKAYDLMPKAKLARLLIDEIATRLK